MTLGGETESSNPSRLMFSIKIPAQNKNHIQKTIELNAEQKRRCDRKRIIKYKLFLFWFNLVKYKIEDG